MIAKKLTQAIEWYLGYKPREKVQKKTIDREGNAEIVKWEIVEKKQPTIQKLQQIYDENIDNYELDQAKDKKKIELKNKIYEKLIEQNLEFIEKKALIEAAKDITELENIV